MRPARTRAALKWLCLLAVVAACDGERESVRDMPPGKKSDWISRVVLIVDADNVIAKYDISAPPGTTASPLGVSDYFVPGRVIAFRSSMSLPQFKGTGEEGRVYRLDDDLSLVEVGEFDLSWSEEQIQDRFGGDG